MNKIKVINRRCKFTKACINCDIKHVSIMDRVQFEIDD